MCEIASSDSTFPLRLPDRPFLHHLPIITTLNKHLLLNRIRHPPRRLILLLNRPSPPLPLRHLLVLLYNIAARAAARLEDIRATISIEVILVPDIGALHSRGDSRQAQHAGAAEEKALSTHTFISTLLNTPGTREKHTDPLQHEYPPRSPLLRTRCRVLPYVTHGTQQPTRQVLKGEKQPKREVTHGWAGADLEWRCSLGADMVRVGGRLEGLCGGIAESKSEEWSMTATRTETRRRGG